MAVCPDGHDSAGDDFCDVCGRQIGSIPAPGPVRPVRKHHVARSAPVPLPAPVPFPDLPEPAPVTWTVRVASDRAYYNRMKAVRGRRGLSIAFPAQHTER